MKVTPLRIRIYCVWRATCVYAWLFSRYPRQSRVFRWTSVYRSLCAANLSALRCNPGIKWVIFACILVPDERQLVWLRAHSWKPAAPGAVVIFIPAPPSAPPLAITTRLDGSLRSDPPRVDRIPLPRRRR